MGYTPERTCPLSCHQLCCCGILANTGSLLCADPRTAYNFSLLHLDTHSLTSLIIFTVETLHWTRTTVHTISPTLYYCSFVPGKNRVLIPAHGMVILTDDFLVSRESHKKNSTILPEVRPRCFRTTSLSSFCSLFKSTDPILTLSCGQLC
jgi:hypothetical protein